MPLTVKILGILIVSLVIILLIRPELMKRMLEYVLKEPVFIYVAAVVRILIGSFLLLAASQCKIPIIILILGLLILAAGIFIFFVGQNRAKAMLTWVIEKTPTVHRLFAIVALIIGALLIYAA